MEDGRSFIQQDDLVESGMAMRGNVPFVEARAGGYLLDMQEFRDDQPLILAIEAISGEIGTLFHHAA